MRGAHGRASPSPMRPSLNDLARLVGDLCRLRGGPQEFPHSPALLAGLVVAGVALDGLIGGALGAAEVAAADSALSAAVVLALCALALAWRRLGHRFVQTATALFACSLPFSLLQGALAWLAGPAPADAGDADGLRLLLGAAMLGLFAWGLAVYAHVMRHALNASFGAALALVVFWVLAYGALDRLLFGSA